MITTTRVPSAGAAPADAADSVHGDVTERIAARRVIDHTKGLLMTNRNMTEPEAYPEPEAYHWIQKTAMDRRTPTVLIANTIVEGFGHNASRAS